MINLEVPIAALHRALRSATHATTAHLRLTKKGPMPLLALTVVTQSWTSPGVNALNINNTEQQQRQQKMLNGSGPRERATMVTQEVPVRVLEPSIVEALHEPRCREPDVHIILPSLIQLKSISERFTKLAALEHGGSGGDGGGKSSTGNPLHSKTSDHHPVGIGATGPKLELSANKRGVLRLSMATDALRISSTWKGLVNPMVDPAQVPPEEANRRRQQQQQENNDAADGADAEDSWATVRIDGRDWGRVLSVGRLSPRVVAGLFIPHSTSSHHNPSTFSSPPSVKR